MVKAEELNKWANDILPVLIDINIAITNLQIINDESQKGLHIINHGSFKNMRFQQRFILMVQLAKVFSKSNSQKRNFIKLCTRLESEPFDKEIESLLVENQTKLISIKPTAVFKKREDVLEAVNSFKNSLVTYQASIEKIIVLRDKVYAHSDNLEIKPTVSDQELKELTQLANEMYNTLFGKIFDRHFHFQADDLTIQYVIKKLGLIDKGKTEN